MTWQGEDRTNKADLLVPSVVAPIGKALAELITDRSRDLCVSDHVPYILIGKRVSRKVVEKHNPARSVLIQGLEELWVVSEKALDDIFSATQKPELVSPLDFFNVSGRVGCRCSDLEDALGGRCAPRKLVLAGRHGLHALS